MNTQVHELMRTAVICVEPQWTLVQAEELLAKSEISGAPVIRDGKVIGVFSLSDISRNLAHPHPDFERTRVEEVMSTRVLSAKPDDTMISVMERMLATRIRRIIVTDEEHRPVGIVTALAILEAYRQRLRPQS